MAARIVLNRRGVAIAIGKGDQTARVIVAKDITHCLGTCV
jgi:hypothetical protein